MTYSPLAPPPPLANKIDGPMENSYVGIPMSAFGADHGTAENTPATEAAAAEPEAASENAEVKTANLYSLDDSTDSPPLADKKYKDFLGQAMDMTFGADADRLDSFTKEFGKKLVEAQILPDFRVALGPEINLPNLNPNKGHTQPMLNHYSSRYFALKGSDLQV